MTDAFDNPQHRNSEALAFEAEQKWATGDAAGARVLFASAANLEEACARDLATSPLRGIFCVSAVALWYKAAEYARAKTLAYFFLGCFDLQSDTVAELEDLIERSQRESILDRLSTDPTMIPVEIKLDGVALVLE